MWFTVDKQQLLFTTDSKDNTVKLSDQEINTRSFFIRYKLAGYRPGCFLICAKSSLRYFLIASQNLKTSIDINNPDYATERKDVAISFKCNRKAT